MIDRKTIFTALVLIIIIAGVSSIYWFTKDNGGSNINKNLNTEEKNNNEPEVLKSNREDLKEEIIIYNLPDNSFIKSPLELKGEARGTWFSEGEFPVRIVSKSGLVLGRTTAYAVGNWMTPKFVDFSLEINFNPEGAEEGNIFFTASNPKGREDFKKELRIPVRFK